MQATGLDREDEYVELKKKRQAYIFGRVASIVLIEADSVVEKAKVKYDVTHISLFQLAMFQIVNLVISKSSSFTVQVQS